MKYLKKYNEISKIFESTLVIIPQNKYYIKGKYWEYQLGYIWSPMFDKDSNNNDSSVNTVRVEDDGMSDTLSCSVMQPLFKDFLGTSNLNELCMFYLPKNYTKEFLFIDKGLKKEKKYTFNIDEGSWDIRVKFYEVNGIKILSENLSGTECFLIKRNDMEKLLDISKYFNYYRFVDKDLQLLRMKSRKIDFQTISDIFIDATDNEIKLEDFHQISDNSIMIKFMKENALFSDVLIKELNDNISRFEKVFNSKLIRVDLSRNSMLYVNNTNQNWLDKNRPVYSFTDVNELLTIETMEYDLHLRSHSIYLIFELL